MNKLKKLLILEKLILLSLLLSMICNINKLNKLFKK